MIKPIKDHCHLSFVFMDSSYYLLLFSAYIPIDFTCSLYSKNSTFGSNSSLRYILSLLMVCSETLIQILGINVSLILLSFGRT